MTRPNNHVRHFARLCLLLLASLGTPALAQTVPTGPEVKVSGSDASRQRYPAAAQRKDGFLVVWEDDHLGVQGRKIANTGRAQGTAFLLAGSDPLPPQRPFFGQLKEAGEPAVAVKLADSSFLLVWVERTVERSVDIFIDQRSLISQRLRARRFAATGQPLPGAAGNILEIAAAAGFPGSPAVVANPDGSFWIAWTEGGAKRGGVHLRRLDATGKLGADVRIATVAPRNPVAASMTNVGLALGGDGFIVVWEQCCQASGDANVYARLMKPSGAPNGPAFKVPTLPGRGAGFPAVAGRPGKEFLVVWQSVPTDHSEQPSIHGQLLSKAGAFVQAEDVIVSDAEARFLEPVVGATADRNGWLVVWSTYDQGKRAFVDGRNLDAQLNPVGTVVHFSQGALFPIGMELSLVTATNGRAFVAFVGQTETRQVGIRGRSGKGPVRNK